MRTLIVIGIFLLVALQGRTQEFTSARYAIAIPETDLRSFVSAPSFTGAVVEYQAAINSEVMIGVSMAWNAFSQTKPHNTMTAENNDHEEQICYVSALPLHLNAAYLLFEDERISPYVGLGLGTTYFLHDTSTASSEQQEAYWTISLKPEAGLIWKLSSKIGLKASLDYYNGFRISNESIQSYLTLSTGIFVIGQ